MPHQAQPDTNLLYILKKLYKIPFIVANDQVFCFACLVIKRSILYFYNLLIKIFDCFIKTLYKKNQP